MSSVYKIVLSRFWLAIFIQLLVNINSSIVLADRFAQGTRLVFTGHSSSSNIQIRGDLNDFLSKKNLGIFRTFQQSRLTIDLIKRIYSKNGAVVGFAKPLIGLFLSQQARFALDIGTS